MRPKKRVLLIDSDKQRHSELACALRVIGFALALAAADADAVLIWGLPDDYYPCPVVDASSCADRAEMFDRVRTAVTRKRGPKKLTVAV